MNFLIIFSILIFAVGMLFEKKAFKPVRSFWFFAAFALLIRLFFAYFCFGHKTDVNDFLAWSDMLYKGGLPSFYPSDSFTDYPPGYMYVLWLIGFLKNTLCLKGSAAVLLVKLPSILSDICIARVLKNYFKKKGLPCGLCLLWLFNPAAVFNSSVWGQTDSVLTLLMLISIMSLCEKRPMRAYAFFAAAVFVKPQACMYAPLYIFFFAGGIKNKETKKHIFSMLISASAMLILMLPFGINHVISQYISTLSSYNYASVNAFNVWAALGLNWSEPTAVISLASVFFTVMLALASLFILARSDNDDKYFRAALFICLSVFMLSVKMHERYAYPAMLFALACIGYDMRKYALYLLITAAQFFNTAYILLIYESNPSAYYNAPAVIAASVINIVIFLYMTYLVESEDKIRRKKTITPEKSTPFPKFEKKDVLAISAITLLYSCVAFSFLGKLDLPQTDFLLDNTSITFNFDKNEKIGSVGFYLGCYPLSESNILTFTANDNDIVLNEGDVFSLNTLDLENLVGQSLTVNSSRKASILELRVFDTDGNAVNISNKADFPELFDEALPKEKTYLTGTYFDEIYHARTAYEFIHKLPVYEWTHPPLGKIFISLGIRIFGMNTFGWRFFGVLFGIMMLPVIYAAAKQLFEKTWLCCVTTLIFAFDFMHYTQSRIATIDVFVTFFIMLMYLFMYMYCSSSFYDKPLSKTFPPLLLCGVSTGLAIACKWTGAYAAVGIAVIFFISLARRYREYCTDKSLNFHKNAFLTLLFCVLCFIIIPIGIYCLSYIPYLAANGEGVFGIWQNQLDIFTYHAKTVVSSEHPFASKWYTWPFMLRPIWYYSANFSDGGEAGISAFGNPLVWWCGIAATAFCVFNAVKYKDKKSAYLLIAYAANFLPWAFVERTMFIYHYFPSVPFVALMIGYSQNILYKKNHKIKYAAYVYTLCTVLLFAIFYPVLTGLKTDPSYVKEFLRWLPGWVLIK